MLYSASDPGRSGGWVIIDKDARIIFNSLFTNWTDVYTALAPYKNQSTFHFLLEQVHAMPGQGVSSMFSFGANYGGWIALLEGLSISHILVPPQRWQKDILGSFPKGESKHRARDYIQRRYPEKKFLVKENGIIDALCMALYLRKQKTGLL